jgi:DNA helicase HerA-like ATPase
MNDDDDDYNDSEKKYQGDSNYNNEPRAPLNTISITEIGKTVASDKFPNTMDSFWFVINSNVVINVFDFVTVDNIYNSKTIGIVKELQVVPNISDDYYTYLSPEQQHNKVSAPNPLNGTILAKAAVMANTAGKLREAQKENVSINLPVGINKSVKFANAEEIIFALGIPEMENPIPAGVIETTNGLHVPVVLDVSYLAGPDTAHVNVSGISGNQKTSYLLFLLQSAYQILQKKEGVSLIIFNTKGRDLLYIDKKGKKIRKRTEKLFDILDLDIQPFDNVTYFLPRGKDGRPNSIHIPKNSKTYSYELQDVYDRLEILFSEAYDPHYNLSAIVDYIYQSWPMIDSHGKLISSWTALAKFNEYPESVLSHRSSLLHFLGQLQRFRKSPMFIDKKITSRYLGKEIMKIKAGEVFVIDVATISSVEEQAFVVGDVMKSIDEMYSARHYFDTSVNEKDIANKDSNNKDVRYKKVQSQPKYILVFVDEINRFIPQAHVGRINAVAEQIMKTVIAGRSRGTILFSAQQFKSATDYRLQENTGLHMTAKLGLSELKTRPYSMLDESTKMNIVRLNRGELVMVHAAFRHPIRISFPKASFRKP